MTKQRHQRLSTKEKQELLKRQNFIIEMQQKKDFRILGFKLDLAREVALKLIDKYRNPLKKVDPREIAEYAVCVAEETLNALISSANKDEDEKPEATQPPPVAEEIDLDEEEEAEPKEENEAWEEEEELPDDSASAKLKRRNAQLKAETDEGNSENLGPPGDDPER